MSSETALTGRGGRFSVDGTQVARITQWSVNPKLKNSSEWADSDSAGFANRAAGPRSATFTAEGKYDTDDEAWDLFVEGDICAGILKMSATLYWSFPRSLCNDFKMTVNTDTEEVIGWTSDWGSDGIYYRPGEV